MKKHNHKWFTVMFNEYHFCDCGASKAVKKIITVNGHEAVESRFYRKGSLPSVDKPYYIKIEIF